MLQEPTMQEKLGVFKLLELAVMDLAVSGISEGFSFFEWVGTHSSEVGDNCSPKSPFLRLDRSQAAMPQPVGRGCPKLEVRQRLDLETGLRFCVK